MRLLLLVVLGCGLLILGLGSAAHAQDNPGQLPDWAVPGSNSMSDHQPEYGYQPPGPPPDPDPAPVNGALALLALAGAAYAMRRMGREADA